MNKNSVITTSSIIVVILLTGIAFGIYSLINRDLGISAPSVWLTHTYAGISFAYPNDFELKPSSSLLLSNKADQMSPKVDLTLTPINRIEKYNNAVDFCNSITQYYQELESNLPSIQSPSEASRSAQRESANRIRVQKLEVIQIHGKQVCRYELHGLTEENSSLVYSFFVNTGEKVNVLQAIITHGKSASKDDIDKMRQVVTTLQIKDEVQLPELQFPAI
jgi:DNA-nicking Smr family endonuclease